MKTCRFRVLLHPYNVLPLFTPCMHSPLAYTQNTQPATITWNVMGMMNNCHFRVLLHPFMDESGTVGVRFQHPAPVEVGERGNIGWREEENLRMQVRVCDCGQLMKCYLVVAVGVCFQHPAPVEVGERGNIGWREEENLRMQVRVWLVVDD